MQGYYIHYKGRIPIGVSKKIDMMLKRFAEFSDIQEIDLTPLRCNIFRSLLAFLPFINIKRNYKKAYESMAKHNPDYVYIRRTTADRGLLRFIKKVRELYPACKIIVEIMSYPYDKEEFLNIIYWPYYFKECINRKKYKLYIDRFVTFSDDNKIFGVDTLQTLNGIDVSMVIPVSSEKEYSGINLIAVAGMYKFHGYERLIHGLYNYYKKGGQYEITVHLVGNGPELRKYKEITRKLNLDDNVLFYGKKYGRELDEIYNGMDIAISSLGLYKLGINRISSLKLNEYLAKGLPIAAGCDTVALTGKNSQYYIQFSNDGTPINIEKLVDFYNTIYANGRERKEVIDDIRQFAFKTVDNKVTMQNIINFIVNG